MFLPMFLYSLGVHGPIVHVRLAVVVKVSLLWMSHHGLFPVSRSIFFFFGKSFDACSMFAAKSKFAGKSMFGAKYFKRICICGISK